VQEADDGARAIEQILEVSGLEALSEIKSFNPAIPIIIMTAYSSVETAVEALKKGAYDYLSKPLDFDELELAIGRAMDHTRLKVENRALRETLGAGFNTGDIVGRSRVMVELLETVALVAPTEATVLITGESGTGKQLIASAIHLNSPRREKPFIQLNCAAITETLLESELFGHERGAFTGADRRKEGRFRLANRGSMFLDEISEMSVAMQAKLLRVLQEKEIQRVGGEEVLRVDVRVMAATNRDLKAEIEGGRFREDLYYRLNVVTLAVPALRERREDIPLLAQHFLDSFAEKNRKQIKGFTPQAMDRLVRYHWPGNVRELMNAVERGVILCRGDYVAEMDFPLSVSDVSASEQEPAREELLADLPLEEVEKVTILKTLESAGGNKSETARRLGITRRTLHKKLKKYGVM
jgi:two-component system response regulator HydG